MFNAVDTVGVQAPAGITLAKQHVASLADEDAMRTGQSVDDFADALVCTRARVLGVASEAANERLLSVVGCWLLLLRLHNAPGMLVVVAVDPLSLTTWFAVILKTGRFSHP
jgi:hypothetical protein